MNAITPAAKSAAQSSAGSYPGPPISAIEIPINAASEVSESLRWCQASVRIALLAIDSLVRSKYLNNNSLHIYH